jgi:hypothetical protein
MSSKRFIERNVTCFEKAKSPRAKKGPVRAKGNTFGRKRSSWAIPCLFLPNKISFDRKKSRPKQMRLVSGKQNSVRQKEKIFSEDQILSSENKTVFGENRFCPERTKLFQRKTILFRANEAFFAAE